MQLRIYLAKCLLGIFCFFLLPQTAFSAPANQVSPAYQEPENQAKPAAKSSAEEYAKQRIAAVFVSYSFLLECFGKNMRMEGDAFQNGSWSPEQMRQCRKPLEDFKQQTLNIDREPLLSAFIKTPEGKALAADAMLIDKFNVQIAGIFDWFINLKEVQPKSYSDIHAARHFKEWYEKKAKNYMDSLKVIDKQIKHYENAKNSGKMVSTPFMHFEIRKSKNQEMIKALNELSHYISFNVDNGRLFPVGKGVFLADLDYHSSQFVKNVKGCIRRMEALSSKFKRDWQRLLDMKIMDLQRLEQSKYLKSFARIPIDMKIVLHRFSLVCDDVVRDMKQMAEGANPVGALLIQKNLASETSFARNSKCSYLQSVRDRVAPLLLNTRDKHNKELKHSIRGQRTYPDLDD